MTARQRNELLTSAQVVLGEPAGSLCIVDLYAPSVRLAVEVDEAHHAERAAQDTRRDAALAGLGYRVVRIPAQVVLREPPQRSRGCGQC